MTYKTYSWAATAVLISLLTGTSFGASPARVRQLSPDGKIVFEFGLNSGTPNYRVSRAGELIVDSSRLGFRLAEESQQLEKGFKIISSSKRDYDQTWEQPWGEQRFIRNNYRELKVSLSNRSDDAASLVVYARVFNDGIGFRYEVPASSGLGEFIITDELTEFKLAKEGRAWSIPAYVDNRYEHLFTPSKIAELEVVQTPLTIESEGYVLSIHEANLTDYASMTLRRTAGSNLKADLVPWKDGSLVKARAPMRSPWRTIQIGSKPSDLVSSYLILNLNEPSRLKDTSWIKPQKYVGVWWGMHIDRYSWASGKRHGATTERTKQYMDFAAANNFKGVLVEGWNEGWDGNWTENGSVFNFTKPFSDFDIEGLTQYGKKIGVNLIGHHETSSGILNYEAQVEEAFKYYKKLGINVVKTGYVGDKVEGDEWHQGQYMVRHYRKIVELAARYQIMLDVHEPVKDTGIRRTWPHMMTREGARGQEYNAWGHQGGNPPSYATILPFTRCLAGPFDFTPGIFKMDGGRKSPPARAQTTIAKQLAYYLTIYSPLHMAADLPEHYSGHAALKFIRDVPVDWEWTRVIDDKIGEHVTIVRKDRNSDDIFMGSITNERGRYFDRPLDFLDPAKKYTAEIYKDGAHAHYFYAPELIEITSKEVEKGDRLSEFLAPGGGLAVRFRAE